MSSRMSRWYLCSLRIAASSASSRRRDLEFLHQIGGARVKDPEAVFEERQADRRPQVTFAGPGRADQDQVGALVEPAVACDQGR